jgi:N-acetylneuraminate synthase
MKKINLGSRTITPESTPYIIAEVGVNHEGCFDTAIKLIDLCKEGGADAVKFQTYKAHKIASKHSPSYWDTSKEPCTSQYELFKKYDSFGEEEYIKLAEYAKSIGIDYLSTPFDSEAVNFLDPLMPFFKIASADLTNRPMLKQIAGKGKPVVLSTGASTLGEIDQALEILKSNGCNEIALLHCVLNYPTENQNAHLRMIDGIKRSFPEYLLGYSDHTLPDERMLVLTTAWLKGAVVLEKHFTHDKSLPGNDHYHAMDVNDLKVFKQNISLVSEILGETSFKHYLESELPARSNARRSIVAAKDISEGDIIDEKMLTYKRPGHGISPSFWDEVIGKKATRDIAEDELLQWSGICDE